MTMLAAPGMGRSASIPRHADGLLFLRLRPDGRGRTAIAERHQRFPLRTTMPFHLDAAARDMAFVYVQNPTGGVFAGDRLELRLTVEQDARVHLRTQSATRICQMDGGSASQEIAVALAPGDVLWPLLHMPVAIHR